MDRGWCDVCGQKEDLLVDVDLQGNTCTVCGKHWPHRLHPSPATLKDAERVLHREAERILRERLAAENHPSEAALSAALRTIAEGMSEQTGEIWLPLPGKDGDRDLDVRTHGEDCGDSR